MLSVAASTAHSLFIIKQEKKKIKQEAENMKKAAEKIEHERIIMMRVLAASVAIAERAGSVVRRVLNVEQAGEMGGKGKKGKNDLQTEADRAAQRCIIASLHKQFPKVAIFGEESLDPMEKIPDDYVCKELDPDVLSHPCPDCYRDVTEDQIVIWVDPLDGTAEFTQGLLDHVTVLIGIAVNGEAKAGVIYQPYYNYQAGDGSKLGRCIWGMVGLGSFGFTREIPPADQNLITTTRSHSDWIVTEAVNSCKPTEVVRVGGAGHKVLLLIEGKVHAYVFASRGCKKWDTCAPEAVLHAIGGNLTDMLGQPILYHSKVQRKNLGGVLATVTKHPWYVAQIPQEIRDNFESDKPTEEMILLRAKREVEAESGRGDSTVLDKNFDGSSVDPPASKEETPESPDNPKL